MTLPTAAAIAIPLILIIIIAVLLARKKKKKAAPASEEETDEPSDGSDQYTGYRPETYGDEQMAHEQDGTDEQWQESKIKRRRRKHLRRPKAGLTGMVLTTTI